ncbi:AraC family transcriptional regulator [Paenibacillus sp. SYP-B3998]|uniref:AraC family transcriptional regulator n=1 Tax=Paenibacillus sp. SYP-B3998 TaxID=2678564 RepID=A0A6G3ZRY5_9BACL|nr:AraC family transcriptional regulator [Paenibacillus sp. SYP-B3998]
MHYWGIVPRLFDNPIHKHSFFEVCYVLEGEGEYTDMGISYSLQAGTHFCSRPGVSHQIRTQEGLFLLYVAFEVDETQSKDTLCDAFRQLAENIESCVRQDAHNPTALLWKSLLLQEGATGNLPAVAIPTLAYTLLLSFLTLFGSRQREPSTHRKRPNSLLQQAKLYIRDNLSQPLSLQHVAEYLHVSERHLSRLFSSGIHESYTDFIRSERIRQATHLLLTSNLSIKEISEVVGFSSVHYFSRLFMEVKKLPPGKFRKREINSE